MPDNVAVGNMFNSKAQWLNSNPTPPRDGKQARAIIYAIMQRVAISYTVY